MGGNMRVERVRSMTCELWRARQRQPKMALSPHPIQSVNIERIIGAVQAEVGAQVDGKAGPETWRAIHARLLPAKGIDESDPAPDETVDARSETIIVTLLPEVRPYARALVQRVRSVADINIKLVSGLRTWAEQDALYAQGRTAAGPKVTNARGGYSNHNFGIAFDIGVWEGQRYLPDSPKYKAVGALGMTLGLEWGGHWTTIVDQPHFQLRPAWAAGLREREMLAELRVRAIAHRPVYS